MPATLPADRVHNRKCRGWRAVVSAAGVAESSQFGSAVTTRRPLELATERRQHNRGGPTMKKRTILGLMVAIVALHATIMSCIGDIFWWLDRVIRDVL
jgi:hypothetical protein